MFEFATAYFVVPLDPITHEQIGPAHSFRVKMEEIDIEFENSMRDLISRSGVLDPESEMINQVLIYADSDKALNEFIRHSSVVTK